MDNAWAQVDRFENKDTVDADTLNTPIDQLSSRTEYLKAKLNNVADDGASLVIPGAQLVSDGDALPEIGDVVYATSTGFMRAQAKMHLYDDFTVADSAFTIGILISKSDATGDVLIYGRKLLKGIQGIYKSGIVQSGEEFCSGRYYLSATEPGKLSKAPGGPLIYVCSIQSDSELTDSFDGDDAIYVNPQFLDIGTSHVHRAYALVARPAGDVDANGNVIGYLPTSKNTNAPRLSFRGTWTSVNDVSYVFKLEDSSAWGAVKLTWTKDGAIDKHYEVEIPATGVFVALDNGLEVKVDFPKATGDKAWDSLVEADRTWELTFPTAGKGWANHCVTAVASSETPVSEDGAITPTPHVGFSGTWPANDNTITCLFPENVYNKEIGNTIASVTVGGVEYTFEDGDGESSDTVIYRGSTMEETLLRLAKVVNTDKDPTTFVISSDDATKATLVSTETIDSESPTAGEAIELPGAIPLMLIYDAEYLLLGGILQNKTAYVPFKIGGLDVVVYATDTSSSNPCTVELGTRLTAHAYDYAPDAVYDYVMGLHQEVDYYFPPIPAQAAGLFVNGVEMEESTLFPTNPTYKIGHDTLHWMEEEEGKRPWPKGVTTHDAVVAPAVDKTMAFYFVVGFQCATGPVTSLTPAPESPIKIYTYGTNESATTGDLMIDVTLDLESRNAGVVGCNVIKKIQGNRLLAGNVVEKIVAGDGISVISNAGEPTGQGTVTVSLAGNTRGSFDEIALENAKQEKIGLFPYVSLLGWSTSGNNIPSAFTLMTRVSDTLDPDSEYRMNVDLVVFGTGGYDSPTQRAAGVQLEYNVLPDFTGTPNASLKDGLLIPSAARSIAIPFGSKTGTGYVYKAYDPFVATTDVTREVEDGKLVHFSELPIPSPKEFASDKEKDIVLKPGYLVALRISRSSLPTASGESYDAYTSPIGFLATNWEIYKV